MRTMKRRRKEGKTDYLNRLKLLKSGTPRVAFRKTNRYLIAQYIESNEAQDKVIITISTKNLLNYGWDKKAIGSLKSISASYFAGFLMGKKIIKEKVKTPIVDFGMIRTLHKSKVFGFLKGLIDAGIKIECKEEFFPEEKRIMGEHLKNKIDFNLIKSNIEKE